MKQTREDISTWLAARRYLYAMFQGLFGTKPSDSQTSAYNPTLIEEAFSIIGVTSDNSVEFLEELRTFIAAPEALVGTYNRLFIGPAPSPAPPWESVYVANTDVLFGHSTLEVRNVYRACGFLPAGYPSVADDHIALELGLLVQLGERALTAWETENNSNVAHALDLSSTFIKDHLGRWIGSWSERLNKAEQQQMLYTTAAQCATEFVQHDQTSIQKMLPLFKQML